MAFCPTCNSRGLRVYRVHVHVWSWSTLHTQLCCVYTRHVFSEFRIVSDMILAGSLFLSVGFLTLVVVAWMRWRMQSGEGRVQVVVLGDAGRSPRMQYHCFSLLEEGFAVDLVGYGGKKYCHTHKLFYLQA